MSRGLGDVYKRQLFDFLRRVAFNLREKRHRWPVKIGKHVDRQAWEHISAVSCNEQRCDNDEHALVKAQRNECFEHRTPPSADLVHKGSALDDDLVARLQARRDVDAFAIQVLDANGRR